MRCLVETPTDTLEGMVDECQDLDGRFVLVTDEGERFIVSGWTCEITVIEE